MFNLISFALVMLAFAIAAAYVATHKRASLALDVAPQYDRMLRVIAKRHQEPRRFPIRNERQQEHYMKESLAAMHTAHFHDHG